MRLSTALLFPLLFFTSAQARDASEPWGTIWKPPAWHHGYSDQPQISFFNDSYWVCVLTFSADHEGQRSQSIGSTVSRDLGRTWSALRPIANEAHGRAASWVNPLRVGDKLFAFYTFNTLNTTRWLDGSPIRNSNLLGQQVYRWSSDAGATWEGEHSVIDVRRTTIDENNAFNGTVLQGWSVGKPFTTADGTAYLQYTKIGCPGNEGGCKDEVSWDEAWLFRVKQIATQDPSAMSFDTLPTGDTGLASPNRSRGDASSWVAEEGELVEMGAHSPSHLYYVYRTANGYLNAGTSFDGGESFEAPLYVQYNISLPTHNGRLKNPRGPIAVRQVGQNRYLMLYFNRASGAWNGRNPYWLTAGCLSTDHRTILWSQPEVVLYMKPYGNCTTCRLGYPDLFQQAGEYWMTETNKAVARIHRLDKEMVEAMFQPGAPRIKPKLYRVGAAINGSASPFDIINLVHNGSTTIEVWATLNERGSDCLLSCGLLRFVSINGSLLLEFPYGSASHVAEVRSEDLRSSLSSGSHQFVVTIDGNAGIVSIAVDGVLLDGGAQYGKGFFYLTELSAKKSKAVGDMSTCVAGESTRTVQVFGEPAGSMQRGYLWSSEVLGLYNAAQSTEGSIAQVYM